MRENQPSQASVTDMELFKHEITQIVSRLHPVIASQLGNFATEEDIADVAQSTWESAWRSRRNFDPDKGPLQSWVVSIARYRAIDRFNQKLDDVQKQKTYQIHASAAERSAPMFAVQAADHADEVVDALDASHEVTAILRVVEDVIQSRESTARGLSLILIFNDDVAAAAKSLAISQDALRRARRERSRWCQVVAKANCAALGNTMQPTLRRLIECLPERTEAGDWTRQLAVAAAQAGGFEQVTIEHVMDVTGYSYNTARQYLTQSTHLLQVAATTIQRTRQEQTDSES